MEKYKFFQCKNFISFLCNNMSEMAASIILIVITLVLAHFIYKLLNSFYLGKVLIYLSFIILVSYHLSGMVTISIR